jgi:hypothetical protein
MRCGLIIAPLFWCLLPLTSAAQQWPEVWWAIKHPFIARKAFNISMHARAVSDSLLAIKALDADGNGGQVDAFRHAYWMAMLSQQIKPAKALKLGMAHEKANFRQFKKAKWEDGALPDSVASQMDLINNKIGCCIGACTAKNAATVFDQVMQAVINGNLFIILKNADGQPTTCRGEVITSYHKHSHWQQPKCLVPSNALPIGN